ncbi:hypothetical protein TEA_024940 [Camellia sinensis var. sinensis]|uniref:RRM domain-containing protein n=1 Tax=Camellia sinensis var. sinensis TaxID=542762 RepID=A0A4S4F0I1_CAMSN|nr:hypothetical protein TEA_024940 [Camellia sinensis var. sinensis]
MKCAEEIPDEGEMDADVDMSRAEDDDLNSKDLEDMKKALKEIEEEAGALREMQSKVEKEMGTVQDSSSPATQAEKEVVDSRSIYVGNVREYIKGCVLFYKRESCSSVDSEEFEPEALVDSRVAHRKDNSEVKTGWKRHIEHFYVNSLIFTFIMGMSEDSSSPATQAEKEVVDSRSIYVGRLCEEVQQHFQSCGTVNRVTILTDKFGQPEGFAYVEFVEIEAFQNALLLNESELHGC